MKKLLILFSLLLNTFIIVDSNAQSIPLVYTVENTGVDCPKPPLPALDQLPIEKSLPDPFKWSDGRGRISSFSDWRYRRAEIKAEIENYEIGPKPPRPDTITASYSGGVLTVNVKKNGKTLTITSNIILPSGAGPFPAVIGMNSPSGSIPSSIFSSRNIAQITFSHNQVTTYYNHKNTDTYYQLYPMYNVDNTGQYSAWAWGVSRIIDGLELVQNVLPIDLKHLAVTGCSYAGKMALFAGALDERIALTIAQESGGGGATSWRYSHSEPAGTVEKIDNTDSNWFMNNLKQFSGDNVWKMPEDHHELMAMCAPRALLVTANSDFTWLSNPSSYVCSKAAQQIYNSLGIGDRFGFSIIGGHGHCAVPNSQVPEIEAFVDKFLIGKENINTNIATTPYSIDLSPWISWGTLTLTNNPSYFKTTKLVYPTNFIKGLDKNITLKWRKVSDAGKYLVQLSTDPTFKTISVSDSTADTVKAVTDLPEGKKYFWRIQIKNLSGSVGPFSEVWNFSTYIPLPTKPQLIDATPSATRAGVAVLRWRKVKDAEKYIYQLSDEQNFASYWIKDSTSTEDTIKTLTGLYEGQKYYWRIQAKNITGASAWSDPTDFITTLSAPTDLTLKKSGEKEITLTWTNNTSIQDGTVIERKMSSESSFTVLDNLKGSGNEYVDTKIGTTETYIYRVSSYTKFIQSDYSNEASLYLVGVEKKGLPTEYMLNQNYPNPFNPETVISWQLPVGSNVILKVYDILGREVAILANEFQKAGYYNCKLQIENGKFASGVYIYQLRSGNFVSTNKMLLLK